MNLTHVHLFLNHIPFLGLVFTIIFLSFSIAKKNIPFVKIFLWTLLFFSLVTIAVYLTGDPAEESVQNFAGIKEEVIEPHETAALISFILMEITGLTALISLLIIKKKNIVLSWMKYSIITLSVITIVSFVWTAKLGGEIRHPEVTTEEQKSDNK